MADLTPEQWAQLRAQYPHALLTGDSGVYGNFAERGDESLAQYIDSGGQPIHSPGQKYAPYSTYPAGFTPPQGEKLPGFTPGAPIAVPPPAGSLSFGGNPAWKPAATVGGSSPTGGTGGQTGGGGGTTGGTGITAPGTPRGLSSYGGGAAVSFAPSFEDLIGRIIQNSLMLPRS